MVLREPPRDRGGGFVRGGSVFGGAGSAEGDEGCRSFAEAVGAVFGVRGPRRTFCRRVFRRKPGSARRNGDAGAAERASAGGVRGDAEWIERAVRESRGAGRGRRRFALGRGRLGDVAGSAALGAVVETGDASSFSALAKVVGVEAVAYSYLALLFPKRLELPEPPTRNDLSAPQIEWLQTLFRIAREHRKTISGPLEHFGLLDDWSMERIVGFSQPGALDTVVDGVPLWLLLATRLGLRGFVPNGAPSPPRGFHDGALALGAGFTVGG